MKSTKIFSFISLLCFAFFSSVYAQTPGETQWARSVTSGPDKTGFSGVAVDSSGNTYAAGYLHQAGIYDFGNGVTVNGTYPTYNIVATKYDNTGNPLWAKSVVTGIDESQLSGVALDHNSTVMVGRIDSSNIFGFGNGVTASGTNSGNNALIVKYDTNGNAQWAKSVTAGTSRSWFNSAAVDGNGNIYVAGVISGSGIYNFGNGVTASGIYSGINALMVKYDASGNAQWAKSVSGGSDISSFSFVAIDNNNDVYVAGTIFENSLFNFGNGVTVSGSSSSGPNSIMVKYDTNGNAQWAKSITSGAYSSFYSVAVDSSKNAYAAGYIHGTGTYDFGNGVTVSGTYSASNFVVVKYDSNGNAQWAKSLTKGDGTSESYSLAVDSSKNIYAVGCFYSREEPFDFGNGVTVTGAAIDQYNIVLVKYDSDGNTQWAKSTAKPSTSGSRFNSVDVDNNKNIYAGGSMDSNTLFGFGNDVTVTGISPSNNLVLVKYSEVDVPESNAKAINPNNMAVLASVGLLILILP